MTPRIPASCIGNYLIPVGKIHIGSSKRLDESNEIRDNTSVQYRDKIRHGDSSPQGQSKNKYDINDTGLSFCIDFLI